MRVHYTAIGCMLAIAFASCATPKVGQTCPPPSLGPAPEELQVLFREGGFPSVLASVWAKLDSSIGSTFPDFVVTAPDGSRTQAHQLIRGATAFVMLPPNEDIARAWRSRFKRSSWRTPSGREVVILVRASMSERIVPRGPHVYVYEPPLPDFLGYAVITPIALFASASRQFEGYSGNLDEL